ncbi:UPF0149 family protein [Marinobacter sp.]|jgi:yecA family protein|uniref:UPF0149 family protein n=1 Tax=Marinobacter sp. TaxID=50741 RepID=UPI0019B6FABE|nr:UPF0149 family protein [Marinobacter sp.]MBC7192746.1 UPF0149 family protein [Marinobacter sp.]
MPDIEIDNQTAASFEQWANLFSSHKAFSHPSELHGGLCGRLAAGSRMDARDWLALVCEQMGLPESAPEESVDLKEFMTRAYDQTLELLKASDMSFQPLMPDDDYALEQRLEALSCWVRGFLEGLALSAGASLGEAPEEIREVIGDMVAISQVADQEEEGGEESEQQLLEIVEYVRLGALSVFTEFNPPESASSKQPTLH